MKFNVEKLKRKSRPMTEEERKDIDFRRENRELLAISERLALQLHRVLRTEDISPNELATQMDVTQSLLANLLTGKLCLDQTTIHKIENFLSKTKA